MFEKDDLGLSLGFNLPKKQVNLKSNPSVSLTPSSSSFGLLRRSSLNESFNSSGTLYSFQNIFLSFIFSREKKQRSHLFDLMHAVPYSDSSRVETRTFIRGIDVNQPPSTAEYGDEDAGVSSPNSTVSSSTGKRSEREEDTDPQGSRGISDDEDGDNSRKKLRLSKDQSAILEETFKDHSTLNPKQKQALAKQLGLRARQVEVWFQNRRAR